MCVSCPVKHSLPLTEQDHPPEVKRHVHNQIIYIYIIILLYFICLRPKSPLSKPPLILICQQNVTRLLKQALSIVQISDMQINEYII